MWFRSLSSSLTATKDGAKVANLCRTFYRPFRCPFNRAMSSYYAVAKSENETVKNFVLLWLVVRVSVVGLSGRLLGSFGFGFFLGFLVWFPFRPFSCRCGGGRLQGSFVRCFPALVRVPGAVGGLCVSLRWLYSVRSITYIFLHCTIFWRSDALKKRWWITSNVGKTKSFLCHYTCYNANFLIRGWSLSLLWMDDNKLQ